MSRMVDCVKLKKQAEGLEYPPYPGDLGARIWKSISQRAWEQWMEIQTRLVNEHRLNLADVRARRWLAAQMEDYLFEDADVEARGYVPPPDDA
ncbi:MAG: oxidative damage protection protein [Castellaniella sp.]